MLEYLIDYVFLLKVLLSFIVGGAIISLFISIGERLDAKKSGLLIGLPITSAIGLFFIGLTQSPEAAAEAATIMPITLAAGLIFLFVFFKLYGRIGLVKSLVASAIVFCLISAIFAYFSYTNIFINAAIYIAFAISAYLYAKKFPEKRASIIAGKDEIIARAVFAGFIVAVAVVAAKAFGAQWGGISAAFPATYVSTMYIAVKSNGIDFAKSLVKWLPFGLTGSLAYYFVVYYSYPGLGLFMGTAIAYIIAVAAIFTLKFAHSRK